MTLLSSLIHPQLWTLPVGLFLGTAGLPHRPTVESDSDSVEIYIPKDEVSYDYLTYQTQSTSKDKIALLMRSSHIFPQRDILNRSSKSMQFDNYTLIVAVKKTATAQSDLYVKDGNLFDY
ncbi:hypothetical protein FOXB_08202 [Fusarium oxysporum f. sp. conglutinans Fo5176]|uniref:Uncharacterized protein n=1 Tax=Fusarium oxysporum (strain Fo5176) TaxID=660025 RepID=F9FP72_FUSOF|nr:hypothetical protein FOXB_08202 [Fusarium oxysporum f. sp. conglutinans Fo5176]